MHNIVKLYKTVNGERRLMDYGVRSRIMEYRRLGYDVELSKTNEPVFAALEKEFNVLWNSLSEFEQRRFHDIKVDDEMSMAERVMLLKAEILRPRRTITVTHRIRRKPSFWDKVKSVIGSLNPIPAFAFA